MNMEKLPVVVPQEDSEDIEKRRQKDAMEKERSVVAGAEWILAMLEKTPTYSERIPLNRDRSFNIPRGVSELPLDVAQLVRSANRMEWSQKGLYDLAKEISKLHPELKFSFTMDPEGQWVEYSAKKQVLEIGGMVLWEQNGILQWREPKKIKSIHQDPTSKRRYAFVEGVVTALPLDELVVMQK